MRNKNQIQVHFHFSRLSSVSFSFSLAPAMDCSKLSSISISFPFFPFLAEFLSNVVTYHFFDYFFFVSFFLPRMLYALHLISLHPLCYFIRSSTFLAFHFSPSTAFQLRINTNVIAMEVIISSVARSTKDVHVAVMQHCAVKLACLWCP